MSKPANQTHVILGPICGLCGTSFENIAANWEDWCPECRKCEKCGSAFLMAATHEGLLRCLACLHLRSYVTEADDG